MRKNWLVTVAGIMAALGSVPILVATSGVTPPAWWSSLAFPFILIGIIGTVLLGYSAKGQDEHSTSAQVQASTIENPGIQAAAVAQVKAEPPQGAPKRGGV
jgi:hypothetical protein